MPVAGVDQASLWQGSSRLVSKMAHRCACRGDRTLGGVTPSSGFETRLEVASDHAEHCESGIEALLVDGDRVGDPVQTVGEFSPNLATHCRTRSASH